MTNKRQLGSGLSQEVEVGHQ